MASGLLAGLLAACGKKAPLRLPKPGELDDDQSAKAKKAQPQAPEPQPEPSPPGPPQ